MPSLLGKRKSRPVEEGPDATADAQEMLRRHFEARFKPLAGTTAATAANGLDSDDGDDSDDSDASQSGSDWGGVSDGEGMPTPLIEAAVRESMPRANAGQTQKVSMLSWSSTTDQPPRQPRL